MDKPGVQAVLVADTLVTATGCTLAQVAPIVVAAHDDRVLLASTSHQLVSDADRVLCPSN